MKGDPLEISDGDPPSCAQGSERHLAALVYALSHDLRAPLRAIDGFSRALEQDMSEGAMIAAARDLQEIRMGVGRMHSIINKWMSMINGVSTTLRHDFVDLTGLAQSVFKDLKISEPYREVGLKVADGLFACGDEVLLRELLQNLIGNAWKFSGKPGETAIIEVGRAKGGSAYFVRDNGIGLVTADAERIFEPFYRMQNAGAVEGNGMGLAIVRHIVELHGGMVWAEGLPGKGTTIYFTLPTSAHIADVNSARSR